MSPDPTPDVVVDAPSADEVNVYPETADLIESIPTVVKESKAGHKTTEFWLTVITSVLVVLNGIPLPEKYEGFVVAALGAVYALSRGLAKKGIPVVEEA
jgi:hypothetical protein